MRLIPCFLTAQYLHRPDSDSPNPATVVVPFYISAGQPRLLPATPFVGTSTFSRKLLLSADRIDIQISPSFCCSRLFCARVDGPLGEEMRQPQPGRRPNGRPRRGDPIAAPGQVNLPLQVRLPALAPRPHRPPRLPREPPPDPHRLLPLHRDPKPEHQPQRWQRLHR